MGTAKPTDTSNHGAYFTVVTTVKEYESHRKFFSEPSWLGCCQSWKDYILEVQESSTSPFVFFVVKHKNTVGKTTTAAYFDDAILNALEEARRIGLSIISITIGSDVW